MNPMRPFRWKIICEDLRRLMPPLFLSLAVAALATAVQAQEAAEPPKNVSQQEAGPPQPPSPSDLPLYPVSRRQNEAPTAFLRFAVSQALPGKYPSLMHIPIEVSALPFGNIRELQRELAKVGLAATYYPDLAWNNPRIGSGIVIRRFRNFYGDPHANFSHLGLQLGYYLGPDGGFMKIWSTGSFVFSRTPQVSLGRKSKSAAGATVETVPPYQIVSFPFYAWKNNFGGVMNLPDTVMGTGNQMSGISNRVGIVLTAVPVKPAEPVPAPPSTPPTADLPPTKATESAPRDEDV
jgi:hypothetical protein